MLLCSKKYEHNVQKPNEGRKFSITLWRKNLNVLHHMHGSKFLISKFGAGQEPMATECYASHDV